ncbi:hypothetical protein QTN25_010798 [Entamoeba marina]
MNNKSVVIVHPDLGIGGAERLVVDLALALEHEEYDVRFYTSHHDPKHCFPETKGRFQVFVHGDFIPRSFFGFFYIFFATIRALYLSLIVSLYTNADVYIVDQISVGVPIFKLFNKKVLFYCHFPDKLLSPPGGMLKKFYRYPFDWLEESCMSFADSIVVNSKFTQSMYEDAFKSHTRTPSVLYPTYNPILEEPMESSSPFEVDPEEEYWFVSINRYEAKKHHELAIEALSILPDELNGKVRVIIAGGYDHRVKENDEVYQFLQNTAKKTWSVLYTPAFEHFGIVPLEAMIKEVPVIACCNGGPLETIQDKETGILCDGSKEGFAEAMKYLCLNEDKRIEMKQKAKTLTKEKFGFQKIHRKCFTCCI